MFDQKVESLTNIYRKIKFWSNPYSNMQNEINSNIWMLKQILNLKQMSNQHKYSFESIMNVKGMNLWWMSNEYESLDMSKPWIWTLILMFDQKVEYLTNV